MRLLVMIGGHPNDWGLIPTFLDNHDPRPAAEQFNSRYIAGWNPFDGFKFDPVKRTLKYPSDPLLEVISEIRFRNERIMLFPSDWVVIVQPDGSWQVSRMD